MVKLTFNGIILLLGIFMSSVASAGHLFTQASANTPINLSAGNGIQITQVTYENNCGGSCNGDVSVNFNDNGSSDPTIAWSAGDAIKITIGAWNQTFTYDGMVAAGGSQSGSNFYITSSSLAAANIAPNGQTTWTVIATAGQFTFEGYRIYTAGGTAGDTYNGTGAGPVNQSQVVSEEQLGGGGVFVPVALPNEKSVAATLDGLSGATGQLGAVLTALTAMTDDSKRLAMKLISPDRSQVMGQSATNTITAGLDTVQVRLDTMRLGMGVESNFRTSFDNHGNHDNNQNVDSGMASGDAALNRSFWLKAFGGKADQDGKHGYAGSDSDMYGMMAGFDRSTESGWLLGAALAYAKTNVDMTDYRNGDDADIKTYQLTGYFAKNYDRWYLQGMLSYAFQDYETRRNTHLTGVAKGDFNGDMYGMRLVAGMPFTLREEMTLTPSVGVEALRINQDSYTEKGAGVLSLHVGDSDANRVRSLVGLELANMKLLSDGSKLRPSLKANWRHEFNNDGMDTTSSFIGGGSQFESIGQDVNRDVFGLSAKLNWEKTERVAISVEVGAEKGDGYTGINGQLMGLYRF